MPQDPALMQKLELLRTLMQFEPEARDLVYLGEDLPAVPRAPAFRREPLVVGTPLAQAFERVKKLIPSVGRVPRRIASGPTVPFIDSVAGRVNAGQAPPFFMNIPHLLNLAGVAFPQTRDVYINPDLRDDELDTVLVHELAHLSKGGRPEKTAERAANLAGRIINPTAKSTYPLEEDLVRELVRRDPSVR